MTTAVSFAWAQTAPPMRVRGTIASVAPHSLMVTARDGQKLDIGLADKVSVATVKKLDLSAIVPGSYVGVATRNGAGGMPEAIEVLVFPPAMRGAGEGHYAWDLEAGSMMTNANVDSVVEANSGRNLTLSYKGGSLTVHVPPQAPVVTFAPADAADLKPGAPVFLAATKNADGMLTAARVVVGTNGVAPPM